MEKKITERMSHWLVDAQIFWYGLFTVYALWGQGPIIALTNGVVRGTEINIPFGLLLLLLMVVEPYFFVHKLQAIFSRGPQNKDGDTVYITLMIGRMLVYTMFIMVVIDAFVVDFEDGAPFMFLMVAHIIKEIIIMVFAMPPETLKKREPLPFTWREFLGDGYLLLMACIGYSMLWEGLINPSSMPTSFPAVFVEVPAAILLFVLIYFPFRATAFVEAAGLQMTGTERFWWWVSLIMVVGAGISPMLGW